MSYKRRKADAKKFEQHIRELCEQVWDTGQLRDALKPAVWPDCYTLQLYVNSVDHGHPIKRGTPTSR